MSAEEAKAAPTLATTIFYDVTMRHDAHWIDRVVESLGDTVYITIDCDGMDPSVMPGTSAPLPGGLMFDEAVDLLTGLAQRGTVVGINFAEHYPSLDTNGITALAIVRLIVNLVGTLHRGGS